MKGKWLPCYDMLTQKYMIIIGEDSYSIVRKEVKNLKQILEKPRFR